MPAVRRRGQSPEAQQTTTLELFYDLVFVFAVTQVSHLLLAHLSWEGAGQTALVLLVVWWAWQHTAWVTNELDPESIPVRLLIIGLMLLSLLIAIAIPEAFGDKALLFAGAYVVTQVGRTAFLAFAAAQPGTLERARASRILIWFCASGVFWIAGAVAGGEARTALWVIGLLIDYGGTLVSFRVPGLPRLGPGDWDLETGHFTERFGLFVIIALGESVVLTGATTAELDLDTTRVAAFAGAFLGSAALWWLYFSSVSRLSAQFLAKSDDRTLLARDAYTFGHAVIIAGIILTAVADELVIAHPTADLTHPELLAVVSGPLVYLLAQAGLRYRMTKTNSPRRLGAAAACVVVALIGTSVSALVVGILLLSILVGSVIGDLRAGARRAAAEAG